MSEQLHQRYIHVPGHSQTCHAYLVQAAKTFWDLAVFLLQIAVCSCRVSFDYLNLRLLASFWFGALCRLNSVECPVFNV